jgi:hypothetical protein
MNPLSSNHSLKTSVQNRLIDKFIYLFFLSLTTLIAGELKFSKYAGEFMSIGIGGRALGMGNAFTSVANDVTAGYWNPAGLVNLSSTQIMLMHDERFAGIVNYDYIGLGLKPSHIYSFALSIIRVGVDDIPYTGNSFIDNNGNGIFDPDVDRLDPEKFSFVSSSDWLVLTSFAKPINEKLSIGANAKFIYKKISNNSGIGLGFDFALKYKTSKFSIGAILKDATSTLVAWDTGRNELVVPSLICGASIELEFLWGKFTPTFDLVFRFEGRNETALLGTKFASVDINAGAEYAYKDVIALRFGFTENKELTLGTGLRLNRFEVDYAFAKFNSELGNTHRISAKFSLH